MLFLYNIIVINLPANFPYLRQKSVTPNIDLVSFITVHSSLVGFHVSFFARALRLLHPIVYCILLTCTVCELAAWLCPIFQIALRNWTTVLCKRRWRFPKWVPGMQDMPSGITLGKKGCHSDIKRYSNALGHAVDLSSEGMQLHSHGAGHHAFLLSCFLFKLPSLISSKKFSLVLEWTRSAM